MKLLEYFISKKEDKETIRETTSIDGSITRTTTKTKSVTYAIPQNIQEMVLKEIRDNKGE